MVPFLGSVEPDPQAVEDESVQQVGPVARVVRGALLVQLHQVRAVVLRDHAVDRRPAPPATLAVGAGGARQDQLVDPLGMAPCDLYGDDPTGVVTDEREPFQT